jgi:hypothetical protein
MPKQELLLILLTMEKINEMLSGDLYLEYLIQAKRILLFFSFKMKVNVLPS